MHVICIWNCDNMIMMTNNGLIVKIFDFYCFISFSVDEIKYLYRGFKTECPSGILTEENFHNIYCTFFPWGDTPYHSKTQDIFSHFFLITPHLHFVYPKSYLIFTLIWKAEKNKKIISNPFFFIVTNIIWFIQSIGYCGIFSFFQVLFVPLHTMFFLV